MIIGVYAEKIPIVQSSEEVDPVHIFPVTAFKLILYTNMMHLQTFSPITTLVEEEHFQYYHIEATCDNCTLLIGISTFSSGDPDLYINYGD